MVERKTLRTKRKTEEAPLEPPFAIRCDRKENYRSAPVEYISFVSPAQRHGERFVKAGLPQPTVDVKRIREVLNVERYFSQRDNLVKALAVPRILRRTSDNSLLINQTGSQAKNYVAIVT